MSSNAKHEFMFLPLPLRNAQSSTVSVAQTDAMIYTVAALMGLLTFALGRRAFAVGAALDVLDHPDPLGGRKRHDRVTPLIGGIATLGPTLLLGVIWLLYAAPLTPPHYIMIATVITAASLLLVLGYLDDRFQLAPTARLLATMMIFGFAAAANPGFRLDFLHFTFLPEAYFIDAWGGIFTVICLTGLSNAVNMADGKNGLVIGLSLIWIGLLALNLPFAWSPLLIAAAATLLLAFMFNVRGVFFLGDAGSYGWSGLIGLMAIAAYSSNFFALAADQVALWFLIPVLDCLRLMTTRILSGRSPFTGDRNHLHHHLAKSMPWSYGLGFYLALVAVPSLLAYAFPTATLYLALVTTAVYAATIAATAKRQPLHKQAA